MFNSRHFTASSGGSVSAVLQNCTYLLVKKRVTTGLRKTLFLSVLCLHKSVLISKQCTSILTQICNKPDAWGFDHSASD